MTKHKEEGAQVLKDVMDQATHQGLITRLACGKRIKRHLVHPTGKSLLCTTTPTPAAKLNTFGSKSPNLIGRVLK